MKTIQANDNSVLWPVTLPLHLL